MKSILLFIKKSSLILFISLFISSTLGFFGPSLIFFTNQAEFSYTYNEIILLLLGVTFILFLFFSFLLSLIQKIIYKNIKDFFLVLIFVVGFLFWVQGSFLVWNYGVLNGIMINWIEKWKYAALDYFVWTFVLILFLIFSRKLINKIGNISIFLIFLQLIYLIYIGFSYKTDFWFKKLTISEEKEFSFSKKKNVIIVIVDTFQSSLFTEILSEQPIYNTFFEGFTFYRNIVGGFPYTQPSIPLILTGLPYDNSVPFLTYVKDKFINHSIPKVLKKNGFISDIYPMVPNSVYLNNEIVSNLKQKKTGLASYKDSLSALGIIYDLTLFRYLPQPAKRFIYNDQQWRLRAAISSGLGRSEVALSSKKNRDVILTERMINEGKVGYEDSVFKFYHFNGVHSPLTLNENLKPEKMNESRLSYKRQATAILKLLKKFLDKLKALNVYDSSMIIITGDHGFGPIGVNNPDNNEAIRDPNFYKNDLFQGAALPLTLIKPFNKKGDLIVSTVPAASSDIPKTIFAELGIKNNFSGESILKLDKSTERNRYFYWYDWKWLRENEFLPDIIEYEIRGDSWLNDSWGRSYKTYKPKKVMYQPPQTYILGKNIQFGKKGDGNQYQLMGWSTDNDGFILSVDNYASLNFPIKKTGNDLKIEINMKPFILLGRREQQNIEVYINGILQTNLNLSNKDFESFTFTIPNEILTKENIIKLSFKLLNPIRPIDFKVGPDKRSLGIFLNSIKITEI